jgi:hypothetical protein
MGKRKKEELPTEFKPEDTLTSKEKSSFRRTKKWIEFRNKTIKARGNKCELCGFEKRLTLHHVHLNDNAISYTTLTEDRFKVLCSHCHKFLHLVERSYHRKKNPIIPDGRLQSILDEYIIEDS